jgi:hypothetical protein
MLLPMIDWKKTLTGRGAKVALISVGVVVGLSGIGMAGYHLWPEPAPEPPPPVETATPDDNVEYAASEDFNRLPMADRLAWIEEQSAHVDDVDDDEFANAWKDLDEATRDQIRKNMRPVMRERVKRQVNEYHRLPPDQREAYLDQRIDEEQAWRSKFRKMFRRDEDGSPRRGDDLDQERRDLDREARRARFAKEMHRFMTKEPAGRRAKTMSYFSAMGKRRAERGLIRMFRRGRR